MATILLGHSDAVQLAHALVGRAARQADARVLFIKGPTAVALGARPARPSSDVDVLTHPADLNRLCSRMEAIGWQRRWGRSPFDKAADFAFDHSVHLLHPEWPVDIDVHFSFPGFLAAPETVFDALWVRRTSVQVAGQPAVCPDLIAQALIVGLHALRDPNQPVNRADVAHVRSLLQRLPGDQKEEAIALACATGCKDTADPLFGTDTAHHGPAARDSEGASMRLREWRERQLGAPLGTAIWAREIIESPLRDRPNLLFRALFPTRDQLLSAHLIEQTTRWEFTRLRVARWRRGLRGACYLLGRGFRASRR